MKKTKVTNLEKFAREQVFLPYSSLLPGRPEDYEHYHPRRFPPRWRLKNVVGMLEEFPEWKQHVMNRIARCNFWFPSYVKHPLVDAIRDWEAV